MYIAVADATVMAVAVVHPGLKQWIVYLAGVHGENHDIEWIDVRRHGSMVSKAMAQLIFSGMPEELDYSVDL
jgi:hypothetical protein